MLLWFVNYSKKNKCNPKFRFLKDHINVTIQIGYFYCKNIHMCKYIFFLLGVGQDFWSLITALFNRFWYERVILIIFVIVIILDIEVSIPRSAVKASAKGFLSNRCILLKKFQQCSPSHNFGDTSLWFTYLNCLTFRGPGFEKFQKASFSYKKWVWVKH